jgi:ribose transport system ATP-binding protein
MTSGADVSDEPALSLRRARKTFGGARALDDVSLTLRRGEILGVSGLAGAGHEALPCLIASAAQAKGGTPKISSRAFDARRLSPAQARALGLALLPADRQRASGAQTLSLRENLSLPAPSTFFRDGFLNLAQERAETRRWLAAFGVRPADPEAPLRALSGGDQQKALLAKWMRTNPGVLLMHEPTQGVDVGAKQDIFRRIEEFAERGVAILIASAESEDLARLCHRVVVLRRGRVAGELAGAALSARAIDSLAFCDASAGNELGTAA